MTIPITAGDLLQYPFDLWAPENLIARTENREIPFQTTMHRGLIAAFLIKNKDEIQNVFDQYIQPIIAIQSRVCKELENRTKSEMQNLKDEETELVNKNLAKYIEAIGEAKWVLPAEGCIDLSQISEGFKIPKCLGALLA